MKLRTLTLLLVLLTLVAPVTAGAAEKTLSEALLEEVNLARTQPGRYADIIREMRRRFMGKNYLLPDSFTTMQTTEGVAALDEAVRFLGRQKPLHPLSWSPGLAKAAADLVREQGASGAVGHDGGRSGGVKERIEKYGEWEREAGENVGYGPRSARLMVTQLIIDDGVPGRGHRKNIFNPAFKVAGAACGYHPVYELMCAMDFAGGFKAKNVKEEK